MQTWLMILAACVLVLIALAVQLAIPLHTAGARKVALTRALLAAIGVAFGTVTARSFSDGSLPALVFLMGFGLVHVPAGLILYFKSAREEGKS
jgi:hypothetical protein